ncbi:UNVERIFIED_CONTAM: AIG2-like protein D [Sesamum calycinum]|uniref:Putative gamma-glutamylcyclotransferase n=1 Tax=Sesamum calycinum TaxID=2727403 RepID=A0AAW2QWP2_9LAMI
MGSSFTAAPPISNVFVYGSLLADDVVRVLLAKGLVSKNVFTLQLYLLKKRRLTGRYCLVLLSPELNILDVFEDVEYERTTADVLLEGGSEKLQADIYVWANKTDPNLCGEWDFEEWKLLHIEDFMKMTKAFMEEMELPDSKTGSTLNIRIL